MSENTKKDSISIIYHQKNDSPKFFEIKRSRVYLFFIGLPAITLISLVIGVVGLIHTSPFHLAKTYQLTAKSQGQLNEFENLKDQLLVSREENSQLKSELTALQSELTQKATPADSIDDQTAPPTPIAAEAANANVSKTVSSIGLSTLSLFKPIQGQKDKTRPAILSLSGFTTVVARDTVNLKFNIIPATSDDTKISGHIVVLMKNEIAIQAYPLSALSGGDFQINYSSGETFATQRFRPVDASFIKPRKSGNYSFTVFIFSRTGDLLHFQTVNLPVKI